MATFTVTNTDDFGPGSLRQAILDANAAPDADIINFNIGTGIQTIAPLSPLPDITSPVSIDGTTQPGFSGAPIIEISGINSTNPIAPGLTISAGNSTVRGLVINRFDKQINLVAGGSNVIEGNYIGTDVAGNAPGGSLKTGISINGSSNNIIGGTTAAARNVISGNTVGIEILAASGNRAIGNYIGTNAAGNARVGNNLNPTGFGGGILLGGNASNNVIGGTTAAERNIISNHFAGILFNDSSGNLVQGNYIGTDVTGNVALGNLRGIDISGNNNTIGGATPGAGNVISGNGYAPNTTANWGAVAILGTGNTVQGNYIGTQADGISPLGNNYSGVFIGLFDSNSGNRIGGTGAGEGNVIAFNKMGGVSVLSSQAINNPILSNSIFLNGSLGIELSPNFTPPGQITPNDLGDADTGANNLQNFPVLTSAFFNGTNTSILGTLNSTANTIFRVDFFANDATDPSGNGEGQRFIGFANVTTDTSGNATLSVTDLPAVTSNSFITATATDPNGNTSEFSNAAPLVGITVSQIAGLTTTEAGGTATFTVVLATQPTANVSVGLSSSNSTEGTVSVPSLTFTPNNWNQPQTVTVTGADDAVADGNIPYSIVTATAVSTDPNYSGLNAADVAVTNNDNDIAGVTVSPTAINAAEGSTNGSYSLVLTSQPTANVNITFDAGNQISAIAPITFTPANWNVAQNVAVIAVDDADVEGNHAGSIVHAATSTDSQYNGVAIGPIDVSIADNDTRTLFSNATSLVPNPNCACLKSWKTG
ncbi:MAG: hypothetical protein HC942_15975 [Microcoleus sp. SU_5_6]|nr:hypothetical protein [Microcoleus sp. SU_5_6]